MKIIIAIFVITHLFMAVVIFAEEAASYQESVSSTYVESSALLDSIDAAKLPRPGYSLRLLNIYRVGVCELPVLKWDFILSVGARRWSKHMRRTDNLHHASFPTMLKYADSDWQIIGENVGVFPTHRAMWRAFMASPTHRANVCNPNFTKVGIGVVKRDGRKWATYRFQGT